MTDFASLLVPDRGQPAHVVQLVHGERLDEWLTAQPERVRAVVAASAFKGRPGDFALVPGLKADDWSALFGIPDAVGAFDLAAAAARLPEGDYRLSEPLPATAALGWLVAQHRFDRYRSDAEPLRARRLLTSDPAHIDETIALAQATALVRDLVDTPANDMGPAELQAAVETIANRHGASTKATRGDALETGYPLVAAVGRAAVPARGARLIELEWGDAAHPLVAIVGKGVCFDSGGLDIKAAAGMRIMKKDMGGAAHALALADLVMGLRLPVRLHLLIPAVENAIAGDAMRPGDILPSRKGLSVEVANTDAELIAAGERVGDPLWRMPLWPGYRDLLRSDVADLNNAPEGGQAGAITAALFLERFVSATIPWAHLDTWAWTAKSRPGRPKGGDALGLRAAHAMLVRRFGAASADADASPAEQDAG